jgi:non-specific serine/threonine protein kinase
VAFQQESLVMRREIQDVVDIGRCLDALGWAASAEGQSARAARLFAAAAALHQRVGAPPHPPWRAGHERYVASRRAALGEENFAAAWGEGRALSLDAAIAYALVAEASDTARAQLPPSLAAIAVRLSRRELEVAMLIALGHTNRQIADALVITEWTTDTYVRHILTKLGLRSRAQVAAWVVDEGLSLP